MLKISRYNAVFGLRNPNMKRLVPTIAPATITKFISDNKNEKIIQVKKSRKKRIIFFLYSISFIIGILLSG